MAGLSYFRFAVGVCVLAAGLLIGGAGGAVAGADPGSSGSAAHGDDGANAPGQQPKKPKDEPGATRSGTGATPSGTGATPSGTGATAVGTGATVTDVVAAVPSLAASVTNVVAPVTTTVSTGLSKSWTIYVGDGTSAISKSWKSSTRSPGGLISLPPQIGPPQIGPVDHPQREDALGQFRRRLEGTSDDRRDVLERIHHPAGPSRAISRAASCRMLHEVKPLVHVMPTRQRAAMSATAPSIAALPTHSST